MSLTKKIAFRHLPKVAEAYRNNENIIRLLKQLENKDENDPLFIQICYDLQSGSYIEFAHEHPDYIEKYSRQIADTLNRYSFFSILEAGVGEATTFVNVLQKLSTPAEHKLAFDLSLSRLLHARKYAADHGVADAQFFAADISNIPLADNSIDLVYTSHALEPNGGREKELLSELYRVTRKYLVLYEPSYEHADEAGRKRMESHGYVRNLVKHCDDLGFKVIHHAPCEVFANPQNRTAVTVIEKKSAADEKNTGDASFCCPITGTALARTTGDFLYSSGSGLIYPAVNGIPSLLPDSAVLATHLKYFI